MDIAISISNQLRNFISEITFTEKDKIKDETKIFEEGIFDSLGFLSLVSFLSEEFKIEVLDEELNEENFETINAIVAYISNKRN